MRDVALYGINALLTIGLGCLVYFGKLDWPQALVGIGLVLTPSAGALFAQRVQS